jgi:ribosomal protein S19E (S16A)
MSSILTFVFLSCSLAAIARQIYLKPGMGVGGLKIRFGGKFR